METVIGKRGGEGGAGIVDWSEKYATGVEAIDRQHKELFGLVNELYAACLHGGDVVGAAFEEAMHRMVDYVRMHFAAEIEFLERIGYPDSAGHRKQHEKLAQNVIEASRSYRDGGAFVPNKFVRTLRDWVLGHIAVSDKAYADYVAAQRKQGLLLDA